MHVGRVMGTVGMYVQPSVSLVVYCTQLFSTPTSKLLHNIDFLGVVWGISGYAFVLKLHKSFKSDFFWEEAYSTPAQDK